MGITDYVKDFVESKVRKAIRMAEHEVVHGVVSGIKGFTHYLMRQFFATIIIIGSIGLLTLASISFCIEYLALTRTLAFLIVGILLLLIGMVIKLQR